jgi:hypothetical protein
VELELAIDEVGRLLLLASRFEHLSVNFQSRTERVQEIGVGGVGCHLADDGAVVLGRRPAVHQRRSARHPGRGHDIDGICA